MKSYYSWVRILFQFVWFCNSISIWIINSITVIIHQSEFLSVDWLYEWYYQYRYWYQNSFQILVIKWNMILIEYSYNNHLFYQFLIFTRSARIGGTSIHSFIFIQILVIVLDWTSWNEPGRLTVWRFGISIHHSIIQYQTSKTNWMRSIETTSKRCDGC